MSLYDITKKTMEMEHEEGLKECINLREQQQKFLETMTVGKMRYRHNQEKYIRLFKY